MRCDYRELSIPPGVLTKLCPLLVKGLNNSEIASALGITEGAVQEELEKLLRAFDVQSRVELLLYLFSKAEEQRTVASSKSELQRGEDGSGDRSREEIRQSKYRHLTTAEEAWICGQNE